MRDNMISTISIIAMAITCLASGFTIGVLATRFFGVE